MPVKVSRVPPGYPDFQEGTVALTHNEFLAVGQANQDIITHIESAKEATRHFLRCIATHNEHVHRLQLEVNAQCGQKKGQE